MLRKLLGQGIGSCSINELQEIDNQLERSLKIIRARKERQMLEENARLSQKCGRAALESAQLKEKETSCSRVTMETDLKIGLPDIGWW
uniref:K-box domain-containing protein n=1 Tax=Solanum lycopersicum TaxID=4081 RepID=A0A3Q7HLM2_SOLLC